jgi:hypothetical protein
VHRGFRLRGFDLSRYGGSGIYFGVFILVVPLLALAAITSLLISTPKVHTNGLTVPVAHGESGPYEYLIGVWPSEPVVGKPLLMSISLSVDQQPVTNASVSATGTVNDRAVVVGPLAAINSIAHLDTYEFTRALNTPGKWVFTVEIKSPLGEGVAEVPLEVAGSQGTPNRRAGGSGLIWVMTAIAVSLVILAFGLVAWGFRRKQPTP